MFAKVRTLDRTKLANKEVTASSKEEQAARIRRMFEQIVPALKEQPGFREIYFAKNLGGGGRVMITLWDSEGAFESWTAVARDRFGMNV